LSNHVASAKRGKSSTNLSAWINDLTAIGKRPSIVLLEECAPEDSDKMEKAWIAQYRQQECALLNVTRTPRIPKPPKEKRQTFSPTKKSRGAEDIRLTRENVRMLGVHSDLHARIKDIAERDGEPIYKIVSLAIDAYEWCKAAPAIPTTKDTTDARS
jgi:hypothetical protein